MKKSELPSTIQRSDTYAQHIFEKAHDNAVKEYGKGARPHMVAYAALKNEYKKKVISGSKNRLSSQGTSGRLSIFLTSDSE